MAPSASPNPPSLLRRPGCWVTFLSVIPLMIGGIYVLENWFGARALARARAELAAEGMELDVEKRPSSRPPDAENFFATPLLLSLGNGTATGPDWVAIRRLGSWHGIASKAGSPLQSSRHPSPTNWAAVRDAIANGDPEAALDSHAAPAAALSMSLGADLLPVLEELSAALDRPHSAIVPSYLDQVRAGQGLSAESSWINDPRKLAAALTLHAALDLEGAVPARGVHSLRIMVRLAEGTENYGASIALVVGGSVRKLAHDLVWSAAARRTLPVELWRELSTLLHAQRPLDRLPLALQTEAVFAHLCIDQLRGASPSSLVLPGSSLPSPTQPFLFLVPVLPRGWIDANEAFVLEAYVSLSRQTRDSSRLDRFFLHPPEIEYRGLLSHHSMGRLLVTGTGSWIRYTASAHAISRLAETACALEAHFAEHQSYPDSLAALVPTYLPDIPLDLDGKPVRFAPDPSNQRYRLWSIGADGQDDGGVEKSQDATAPKPWIEPVGDWLWKYPP